MRLAATPVRALVYPAAGMKRNDSKRFGPDCSRRNGLDSTYSQWPGDGRFRNKRSGRLRYAGMQISQALPTAATAPHARLSATLPVSGGGDNPISDWWSHIDGWAKLPLAMLGGGLVGGAIGLTFGPVGGIIGAGTGALLVKTIATLRHANV
jgi:hypothetical protein